MNQRSITTRFPSARPSGVALPPSPSGGGLGRGLLLLLSLVCVTFTSTSAAQDKKPDPAPPAPPAEQKPEEKPPAPEKPLPGLDELLGLEGAKRPPTDPAVDPDKAELERALTDQQVSEAFRQAIQQMADAADLLEKAGSPGARTQRVQDEIVRKLDILIEQAKKQQSKSQSSASQGQPAGQEQQRQPSQPQPRPADQQQPGPGDNRDEMTPPARQDADLADRLDELQAAWGALPPRVREALSQGAGEEFSAFYRALTEAYYRKLAEEATEKKSP